MLELPPGGAKPCLIEIADAAAIYVLHGNEYYPSAEAVSNGSAVNNNATIPFQAGKTYRIRIINMSALASEFKASVNASVQ